MVITGAPSESVDEPLVLQRLAGGRPTRPVWVNELGGVTYEVGADGDRCFLKWAPARSGVDLAAEAARMDWARAFVSVPSPLELGEDDQGSWMVTSALPGSSAVSDRWLAEPAVAVRVLGEGLRALHEALPVAVCPFSWTAEDRLADARDRAGAGLIDPASWHLVHASLDLDTALELLAEPPPVDELVVCHGDSCAPNTLLSEDGRLAGHVDLGALGTADRWADLAVATWSTEWNYRPGWEALLLDAYGVPADPDRARYYRLLWDIGP